MTAPPSPASPAASEPPQSAPNLLSATIARLAAADWAFTVALAAVALLPRLFVAIAASREPVWDAHYYHFGAERIAQGFGYTEDILRLGQTITKPWAHYPVGYSAALGLVYAIFGSGPLVGPIFGAVTGTALVVVTHRLGRVLWSEQRARWAGALTALHPGLIAYAALLMTEPLAALLIVGAFWAQFGAVRPRAALVGAGVLTGLGALVRPLTLAVSVAIAFGERPPFFRGLARGFVVGLIALVTVLPWTVRNCRTMDGCALISTNGGWNLAIGALTKTGRFEALRAQDGCPIVTGQVQQDRCWAKVGLSRIEKDPAGWLSLAPKKLSQTYDHESFPIEYLREAAPELWPDGRRERGRKLLTVFHWCLIALASFSVVAWPLSAPSRSGRVVQGGLLVGLVMLLSYCFRNDYHPFFVPVTILPLLGLLPLPGRPNLPPGARALLAFVLLTSASHVLFFGEDRYHIVLSPLLCLLAAGALSTPWPHPAQG